MTPNIGDKFYSPRADIWFVGVLLLIALSQAAGKDQAPGEGTMLPNLTVGHQVLPPTGVGGRDKVATAAFNRVGHENKRHPRAGIIDATSPVFLPPAGFSSGGFFATDMKVADLNGDGKLDVVVGNGYNGAIPGNGGVGVLLGNGDGTFQTAHTYDSGGVGSFGTYVAIGDTNGDGKLDLVVTNTCNDSYCSEGGSIAVLLGNGDGSFGSARQYFSSNIPWAVVLADVNNDGKPDILASYDGGTVGVLLGKGDGTFHDAVNYATSGFSYSINVTDINGDGRPDVIAAVYCLNGDCSQKGAVGVLLGNGDGTFQPVVTYSAEGFPYSLTIGDVNLDGKLDVLVTNASSDTIGVLLGNGNGTLQPVVTYPTGTADAGVAIAGVIADINADGKPDFLVTTGNSVALGNVAIFLGNGDGTFQPAIYFSTMQYGTGSIAVTDVNGDGLRDLIVVNACSTANCTDGLAGSVGVMPNNSGPLSPTTTTLTSSPNPSVFGQAVTLTAVVSSATNTPTGPVEFFDASSSLGSASLVHGTTSIVVSSLHSGSRSITAAYHGGLGFAASTSTPHNQSVNMATTTISVASSANPARVKQRVYYTATVASQFGGAVTGIVDFLDGATFITSANVSANRAVSWTTYNTPGTHSITAVYTGDSNNTSSGSAAVSEQIFTTTTTVVTTSGSPSQVGQSVTFTARVTAKVGNVPNGEIVKFLDGNKALASVPLTGGTAVVTTSALTAMSHTIKAQFAGDVNFKKSSGKVTQVVNP